MKNIANTTAYVGRVDIITGEETNDPLFDLSLQPSDYYDRISQRKLCFQMLSQFIFNSLLPENLMLSVSAACVDAETEVAYPILSLNGNYDTVQWMLANEIEILDSEIKPHIVEPTTKSKRVSRAKGKELKPSPTFRYNRMGFKYPNQN